MADTLALPLHHVVGEGEERRRPLSEHAEPLLGSVDQHLRLAPRGFAAVDSRIGRLLLALVAPGGLAQLLEAPFDVEDIIHDLEGEPEIAAASVIAATAFASPPARRAPTRSEARM